MRAAVDVSNVSCFARKSVLAFWPGARTTTSQNEKKNASETIGSRRTVCDGAAWADCTRAVRVFSLHWAIDSGSFVFIFRLVFAATFSSTQCVRIETRKIKLNKF